VLRATVVDGLSTREAAHLLGIPQGTVKSRVRIAKSRLREQLLPREAW
jgi:DNA-directed RNA polymerase specialized sigma24 family protein